MIKAYTRVKSSKLILGRMKQTSNWLTGNLGWWSKSADGSNQLNHWQIRESIK
jgi:hypothetical protein